MQSRSNTTTLIEAPAINKRSKPCEYIEVQLAIDRMTGPQVTNRNAEGNNQRTAVQRANQ